MCWRSRREDGIVPEVTRRFPRRRTGSQFVWIRVYRLSVQTVDSLGVGPDLPEALFKNTGMYYKTHESRLPMTTVVSS